LHFPPEEKKKDEKTALINVETPRSTLTEVETPTQFNCIKTKELL